MATRTTKRKKKSSGKFIQNAIKRPGALTRKKKPGETTEQAASRILNSPNASTQAKQQANFYKNVLKPASKKRKKKSSTSSTKSSRSKTR